ncbi:hypothetical protein ACOMHN_057992 [Nucella lapillus]
MEWTVLLCGVVLASCLSIQAEPLVSSQQENRSQYPDPAALFNSGKPQRVGSLLLLKDYMDQGNTLIKERLQASYSSLKEQLQQGDSVLKEQIVEGVAQVKEQRKEGDERLMEELNEDVAWLKDKLAKGQTRMKEELAEEEAKTKEELAEQTEAFEKLKHSVTDKFKSSMQETVQTIQADLQTTREKVKATEEALQRTHQQLQNEVQASSALKTRLQSAEEEIRYLKVNSSQSSHRLDLMESLGNERDFSAAGSTFIRWGRTVCPDNTSTVYSGVVGGSWYEHTGGASNYLCLVMEPQLDNTTVVSSVNYLYGAEYEGIVGHHNQDVVCCVCWAPLATTLMIPATLTCPLGWTTQYRGHLASGHYGHKGRTEYVCLDEVRENRDGGQKSENGALFYYVIAQCGSLPCPPYVDNGVVTCVVCSM